MRDPSPDSGNDARERQPRARGQLKATETKLRKPRDTACLLVQRLNAIPVQLFPPALAESMLEMKGPLSMYSGTEPTRATTTAGSPVDASDDQMRMPASAEEKPTQRCSTTSTAMGSICGLTAQDLLVVGREGTDAFHGHASSLWCYSVAAQHALNGGRVLYVFAPASGSFDLCAFTECLESLVRRGSGQCSAAAAAAAGDDAVGGDHPAATPLGVAREQQGVILDALDRVDVVACRDVEDLYILCSQYTIQNTADDTPSPADSIVPLVVVEGAGGRGGYIHQYEHAAGQEVPLCQWLLSFQRRVRCALVLVEEVAASAREERKAISFDATSTTAHRKRSRAGSPASDTNDHHYEHQAVAVSAEAPYIPICELLPHSSDVLERLQAAAPHPALATTIRRHTGIQTNFSRGQPPSAATKGSKAMGQTPNTLLTRMGVYYLYVRSAWPHPLHERDGVRLDDCSLGGCISVFDVKNTGHLFHLKLGASAAVTKSSGEVALTRAASPRASASVPGGSFSGQLLCVTTL